MSKPIHNVRGAERIDVAKGSAEERRKSQPENRRDVPVARAAQDAFLQAAGCFVDHLQHAALGDLIRGDLGGGKHPKHGVHVAVDDFAAVPRLVVVAIEAAATLAPETPVRDQSAHCVGHPQSVSERLVQQPPDLLTDVDADLVE